MDPVRTRVVVRPLRPDDAEAVSALYGARQSSANPNSSGSSLAVLPKV